MSGDGHGPGVRSDEGGEDVNDGGLAGAVRSEQGKHGARSDIEVDAVEDGLLAVGLAQSGGADSAGHADASFRGALVARWMMTSPQFARRCNSTDRPMAAASASGVSSLRTAPRAEVASIQAAVPAG